MGGGIIGRRTTKKEELGGFKGRLLHPFSQGFNKEKNEGLRKWLARLLKDSAVR